MFQQILNQIVPPFDVPFGTVEELPIPFDKIHDRLFNALVFLLHEPREFTTNEGQWEDIRDIGIHWGMPHVVAQAIRELDVHWRRRHPQHLL